MQHGKGGCSAVHVQMGPQETPPPKTDSKVKSRKRVHMIPPAGDTLSGRLD